MTDDPVLPLRQSGLVSDPETKVWTADELAAGGKPDWSRPDFETGELDPRVVQEAIREHRARQEEMLKGSGLAVPKTMPPTRVYATQDEEAPLFSGYKFPASPRPLLEVLETTLYDTAAVEGQYTRFFALPVGSFLVKSPQDNTSNVVKTLAHTNMWTAGALPMPQSFDVRAFLLYQLSGPPPLMDACVTFCLGRKMYYEAPLAAVLRPIDAVCEANAVRVSIPEPRVGPDGLEEGGRQLPIRIHPQQMFDVKIEQAGPLPHSQMSKGRSVLVAVLFGALRREVQ